MAKLDMETLLENINFFVEKEVRSVWAKFQLNLKTPLFYSISQQIVFLETFKREKGLTTTDFGNTKHLISVQKLT